MIRSLKVRIIRWLGGYVTVDEAISSIWDKDEKNKILTQAVRRLFNTIGAEDILRANITGEWMHKGKILPDSQKNLLMAEAKNFTESLLWSILQDDVKYQANRKMYLTGKTEMDLVAGKLWTFTLDAMKTRLQSMNKGSGMFNSQ